MLVEGIGQAGEPHRVGGKPGGMERVAWREGKVASEVGQHVGRVVDYMGQYSSVGSSDLRDRIVSCTMEKSVPNLAPYFDSDNYKMLVASYFVVESYMVVVECYMMVRCYMVELIPPYLRDYFVAGDLYWLLIKIKTWITWGCLRMLAIILGGICQRGLIVKYIYHLESHTVAFSYCLLLIY